MIMELSRNREEIGRFSFELNLILYIRHVQMHYIVSARKWFGLWRTGFTQRTVLPLVLFKKYMDFLRTIL